MTKEERREYNRLYREKNKTKIRQYQRGYHRKHIEERKAYYQKNKDKIKKYCREYYQDNKWKWEDLYRPRAVVKGADIGN